MRKIIYLDNASTTQVSKEVIKEINRFDLNEYGNPSSIHEFGERALKAMNSARKTLASEINCKPWEIVFTSGSTESNNLAFFGLSRSELGKKKKKIIISAIEHSSIFEICNVLKKEGFKITEIPVDNMGLLNIDMLKKEIDKNTLLVSIIHVNNEIGIIQDIEPIGKICKERGVIFHSDCAQSFGKIKIDVNKIGINLLTASAHKIRGSKGIGFLYLKGRVKINPIIYGGGQERGLRGGTENVSGIIGFAKALKIIKKINKEKIKEVRDYFISELEKIGGRINGSKEKRIYNNINISFDADAERIVLFLSDKGIMCSTGSACENRKKTESRVLNAIGLKENEINVSLRFSLNENINKQDIDRVIEEIKLFLK